MWAMSAVAQVSDTDKRNAVNSLFDRTDAVKAYELRDKIAAQRGSKPIWHENRTILGESMIADNALMNYGDDGYLLDLHYLPNRRALVGENCTVNKLITVVGVGSWNKDLNNLTNEDLNDYAQFNRVVSAGVTADPIVAIRDMENYYAAGTRAGFCITASSGSAALTLNVVKLYSIGFYRDGELVGSKLVAEGQDVGGVQLSLVQVPGSEDATIVLTATSDWLFDEIQLDRSGGVQAGVADLLKIKYAFVGNDKEFPITRLNDASGKPREGGLYDYSQYTGEDIRLDYAKGWTPVLGIPAPLVDASVEKMVNIDLEDDVSLPTVLAVGYQGGAKFMVKDADDEAKEVFTPGTEVGFHYTMVSTLALDAGSWIRMILYDRNGNKVQEETINSAGVGLSVANGNSGSSAITANVPFSGAEIRFHTVVSLDVGGIGINYGYVRMKPDTQHRCEINPTMGTDICSSQTTLQLRANPELSVSWSLVSAPAGSAVTVTESGYVSHIDTAGEYVFRATCADGCYEDVVFRSDAFGDGQGVDDCSEKLVNVTPDTYELSTSIYGSSGALLSASDLAGSENVLSTNYSTYAEYVGGGNLASNLRIVGVKRKDGNLIFDGEANELAGKSGKRIGFVVETNSTALDLSLLQFLQLRCYNAGVETYRHVITENNGVSAGLIESQKTMKMRYTIVVPNKDADDNYIKFDEFMLWTSGVLNIGASKLRIYYAFIEDDDAKCSYPLNCSATLISDKTTHATLNANETQFGAVADVAKVVNNLSYLIDDDAESYLTILNTVSVGGITIAVNMGRTLDYHHQLGLIIDNKTYVASIGVGSWMTVKTYYNGEATGDEFSDWSVLGADVAGYGDQSFLYMQPTAPYDEVRITAANAVGAVDATNIYGLFVRSDIDNDGIPDCQDDESCATSIEDITITSVCVGDEIVVRGLGTIDTDYKIKFSDASASSSPDYVAADGMVHTQSDSHGGIEVRYTTAEAGLFQMVFYDGSDTPLSSAYYNVHPTRTTWLTTATNNDWNKWDNWSDGAPYCCTDVVIPTGAKYYPELSGSVVKGDEFCCQNIHFEPGGAVGDIVNLDYAQAWVEADMEPNRYHLFSAPLNFMYTGDTFIPLDASGSPLDIDYFQELNATTAPENRFNPTIYQRRWYTTSIGRKWESDGMTDAEKYEVLTGLGELSNLTLTQWSRHFNLLNHPYELGQGMGIWVDNGDLPDATTFRFRYPKWQTSYNYFSDFDHSRIDGVSETLARRDRSSSQPARFQNLTGERFIYETEDAANTTFHFDTENLNYKRFEDRVVYNSNATFPSSVTLTAGASTNHFVFGNPFMSRISVEKFLRANKSVITAVKFYDGNTLKTVSISGDVVTGTTDVSFIAPMQAVLLETLGNAVAISISLDRDMLSGSHSDARGWPVRMPALKISASMGSKTATMMLVEDDDMHSSALLDNEVLPTIAIFGIGDDGQACDILPSADEIPLGIFAAEPDTMHLSFHATGLFPRDEYVLLDKKTGESYSLDDDIALYLDVSSAARFVLRRMATTGILNTATPSNVQVSISKDVAHVEASSPIVAIATYDLQGHFLQQLRPTDSNCADIAAPKGIFILRVALADGTERTFKLLNI